MVFYNETVAKELREYIDLGGAANISSFLNKAKKWE